MVVIDFDAQVARDNGYRVGYNDDGTIYSTKLDDNGPTSMQAARNVVEGNCGSAWATLLARGNRKYLVSTGFSVDLPAVYYSWAATVTGPSFGHTHRWRGFLAARSSWAANIAGMANRAGMHQVAATGSATLVNGMVCGSMRPVDSEELY